MQIPCNNFHRIDKEIRKDSRNIKNRIQSILEDSQFVEKIADVWNLPVLSNDRAGRWYVPAHLRADSVYFKSTDGHTNQWGFSLRRLNLLLLDIVESHGGAIIVDSTRRGKRYPDSLSRTIPIWCAVINNAVFGDATLIMEEHSVSSSERDQIEANLAHWTSQFLSCGVDVQSIRHKLTKPFYPIFVDPTSTTSLTHLPTDILQNYHHLVLCSASKKISDGTVVREGYTYVQGAGDDHELWASSLTPDIFWAIRTELGDKNLSNDELYLLIETHVEKRQPIDDDDMFSIQPTNISISKEIPKQFQGFVFDFRIDSETTNSDNLESFPLPIGKLGAKKLRVILPRIVSIYKEKKLSQKHVLLCCDPGSDIALGVALCILCSFFDDDFKCLTGDRAMLTKALIRKKLVHVIQQRPVNPSRATLNSVNAYLLS